MEKSPQRCYGFGKDPRQIFEKMIQYSKGGTIFTGRQIPRKSGAGGKEKNETRAQKAPQREQNQRQIALCVPREPVDQDKEHAKPADRSRHEFRTSARAGDADQSQEHMQVTLAGIKIQCEDRDGERDAHTVNKVPLPQNHTSQIFGERNRQASARQIPQVSTCGKVSSPEWKLSKTRAK